MNDPLISVTIPVFNGEKFLREALDSIYRQEYPLLEIIVVDDGSTDGTSDIIRGEGRKIRSVRQMNRGPSAALNKGIRLAQGSVLAFLDADDRWHEGMLASLLPLLKSHLEADIVTGMTQRYQVNESFGAPHRGLYFGASLFRREVLDRVGLIDESLKFSEDADWFLRALEGGVKIHFSEQVALHYRQHGGNLTTDQKATFRGYAIALKRSLDRRRRKNDPEHRESG